MVGRWGDNEVIPSPAPPPLLLLAGLVSLCHPVISRGGLYQASQTSVRPADGRGPPHWPRRGRWHVQGFMSRRSACRSEPGSAREGQSLHIHCRTECSDQEVMFLPPCSLYGQACPEHPVQDTGGRPRGPVRAALASQGSTPPQTMLSMSEALISFTIWEGLLVRSFSTDSITESSVVVVSRPQKALQSLHTRPGRGGGQGG